MIVFCSRERNQHVRATNVKHQPGFPAVVINPSDTKCAGPFCYFLLNKLLVSNELFNLCKNHHGKLLVKAQILKHIWTYFPELLTNSVKSGLDTFWFWNSGHTTWPCGPVSDGCEGCMMTKGGTCSGPSEKKIHVTLWRKSTRVGLEFFNNF